MAGWREMLFELVDQCQAFGCQAKGESVMGVFGPGEPDFLDAAAAELRLGSSEAGDVVLMWVGDNDGGELGFCLIESVFEGGFAFQCRP
jgi:hypothetical protein